MSTSSLANPSSATVLNQFAYVQDGPGGPEKQAVRFEKWRAFHEVFLAPFVQYQVPASGENPMPLEMPTFSAMVIESKRAANWNTYPTFRRMS